jgi:predicted Ser/Thr protein kinase
VKVEKIKREVSILSILKGYRAVPKLYEVVLDPVINAPSLILEYAEDNGMTFHKHSENMTPKDIVFFTKAMLMVNLISILLAS